MIDEACRNADRGVIVIGRSSLQNRLLANLINESCGCSCTVLSVDSVKRPPVGASILVLLDVESIAAADIGSNLRSLSAATSCRNIALINADESLAFEQIVTWPGMKGIFFRETSRENLIKGIQAIFNGDYWLPRKILCAHLERTRVTQRPATPEATILTPKEIETLRLLAGGNSTLHIAHKLNVSPHTVKTHIYNLFRKIRVSNRIQAIHWAVQNIEGLERIFG